MTKLIAFYKLLLNKAARINDQNMRRWLFLGMVLWTLGHFVAQPDIPTLNTKTYDNLVRQRLFTSVVDPDILIIDIDEASLAHMAPDFGRWPWTRDTLAATLGWLEGQGAKAVVFDILFSDADTLNPSADASFATAVANSKTSYFPVLRLNPDNDSASQIHASQLPGFATAIKPDAAVQFDPTIAVVPPLFATAVATQRLGYHNVYADNDGVLRHYRLWEDKDGWRINSLPARMAQDFAWPLPQQHSPLFNWPAERLAHASIPFHQVWQLSQSKAGQALDPRFKDKIIIIGATATSLFDVKSTPIAALHPGVGVLATAIDNVKNGSYTLQIPRFVELIFTLLALCAMYFASGRLSLKHIKWAILAAPTLLLGISFASLQWGHWYVDLASAASQAFVFFGLIGTARSKRQNYWGNPANLDAEGWSQAFALRTTHGTTATKLFDSLAPLQVPMCLQALSWQRSSVVSETELWVLRTSANNAEELVVNSTRISQLLNTAPWMASSYTLTVPTAYRLEQASFAESLRGMFRKSHTDHPFLTHDRVLMQRHNAKS
jgi:CHASE2 domain-containing sensor protein